MTIEVPTCLSTTTPWARHHSNHFCQYGSWSLVSSCVACGKTRLSVCFLLAFCAFFLHDSACLHHSASSKLQELGRRVLALLEKAKTLLSLAATWCQQKSLCSIHIQIHCIWEFGLNMSGFDKRTKQEANETGSNKEKWKERKKRKQTESIASISYIFAVTPGTLHKVCALPTTMSPRRAPHSVTEWIDQVISSKAPKAPSWSMISMISKSPF